MKIIVTVKCSIVHNISCEFIYIKKKETQPPMMV
jgi:hypothetical protein